MDGMIENHGAVCREWKMRVAGQGLEEIWKATQGGMPATGDINKIKVGEVVLRVGHMASRFNRPYSPNSQVTSKRENEAWESI
jgi:hypothetical protein